MTPELEIKINHYLANETKLYQDWYMALFKMEDNQYITPVSVLPELPKLKRLCEAWIQQQTPIFIEKLCGIYCCKKQVFKEQQTLLIAATADLLTLTFTEVPINAAAVAVILVTTNYLDSLCENKKNNQSIEDLSLADLKAIALEAGQEAYKNAQQQGFRVTAFRDNQMVWVYPDGRTEPLISTH